MAFGSVIDENHTARLIWAYVEGLVGRDPIDPKILLALWLYATIDGVGSARRLDRLCKEPFAYLWLCGDVKVNYHTLADFRVYHVETLDDLLRQSVRTLLHQGLIQLNRVAQDGMRVRASAGSSSFRRKPSLEKCPFLYHTHQAAAELPGDLNSPFSATSSTCTVKRFETPASSMVMPKIRSAAVIVRLRCVMMMNCV